MKVYVAIVAGVPIGVFSTPEAADNILEHRRFHREPDFVDFYFRPFELDTPDWDFVQTVTK